MKYLIAASAVLIATACGTTGGGVSGDAGNEDAAVEAANSADASDAATFDANDANAVDACTPVCTYNGQSYCVGASFKATDGCNDCACTAAGTPACTKRACVDASSD